MPDVRPEPVTLNHSLPKSAKNHRTQATERFGERFRPFYNGCFGSQSVRLPPAAQIPGNADAGRLKKVASHVPG
jgi:hypothetical protein